MDYFCTELPYDFMAMCYEEENLDVLSTVVVLWVSCSPDGAGSFGHWNIHTHVESVGFKLSSTTWTPSSVSHEEGFAQEASMKLTITLESKPRMPA